MLRTQIKVRRSGLFLEPFDVSEPHVSRVGPKLYRTVPDTTVFGSMHLCLYLLASDCSRHCVVLTARTPPLVGCP